MQKGYLLVIELNPKDQGISSLQVVNGPLFGEFTNHILERYIFLSLIITSLMITS